MNRLGSAALLAGLFFCAPIALGQAPARGGVGPEAAPDASAPYRSPGHHTYDLRRCLELAERNYPKIQEARAKLAKKDAELFRAHVQPYSNLSVNAGIAPAPELWGTDLYSPSTDVALSSDLSLAWQVGAQWTLPIWTFGKITSAWDAARANVAVGRHEVTKAKHETFLAVRRAYYGVLLSRDSLALLAEAKREIDRYLGQLERKVAEGEGDDIELLKLKMQRAELDARGGEARRQETIALGGLRFLTGVQGAFDVPDVPLRRLAHRLAPLPRYLDAARLFRPEINMARAGVIARQAQLRLERARLYPDIGLGLRWTWARAPHVTDQRNPFVRDDFNKHYYGAGLGLEWKLDILPARARLAAASAELEEMRATERFALGGVGVEVEQAYAEARDAEVRLEAYTRALGFAKQWLVKVQQGIDVGTMDEEELAEPAKEHALKRFAQLTAIYDYNMALARLALATGWNGVAE